MNIPKYVQEIMSRSRYCYDFKKDDPRCGVGYTLEIQKATAYTWAPTFCEEIERLRRWVERQPGGVCYFRAFRAMELAIIQTAAAHDLTSTGDAIEDYGEHLYFVRRCGETWTRKEATP